MTGKVESSGVAPDADEYDLSAERSSCPEINNPWWPHSIPTDGVAHKRLRPSN